MKKLAFTLLYIVFVLPTFAQEQEIFGGSQHRWGFMTGYGEQRISNLDVGTNYSYDVKFYQFQYYYAFHRKKTSSVEFLVQPQYNTTKYIKNGTSGKTENGYEFGVNLGFLFRKNFLDDLLGFYALVSIGPHYISGAPARQSSGFIFSDNLSLGMTLQITPKTYLDIRPGIRHISNAGLTRKNGGINDLDLVVGFFRNF